MANPPDVQRALEWGMALLERTPAGDQHVIPGAEQKSSADLAQRQAAAPLKPTKPQKPCDVGLFGDSSKQTEKF